MQSDGRKLLVKCPNKPKGCWLLGNFEKNYEEKSHFLYIIFQQDKTPMHKSKIIGNSFQENE